MEIAATLTFPYVVKFEGSRAFGGNEVLDVSDPTQPTTLGPIGPDGSTILEVADGRACLSNLPDRYYDVMVVDASSLAPIVGMFNTEQRLYGLGREAPFVCATDGNVRVFDMSMEPPQIVGFAATDGLAVDVTVRGDLAYVADFDGLLILDITDRRALVPVGSVATREALEVALTGGHALIADSAAGVRVIDVSDPTSPRLVATLYTGGYATGVKVQGGYAYVSQVSNPPSGVTDGRLQVVDISEPTRPRIVARLDARNIEKTAIVGGYLFAVGEGRSQFRVIDITEPEEPRLVAQLALPGPAYDLAVAGPTCYGGCPDAGLVVVNVLDPTAPTVVGARALGAEARSVVADDAHVCVGADTGLMLLPLHCHDVEIRSLTAAEREGEAWLSWDSDPLPGALSSVLRAAGRQPRARKSRSSSTSPPGRSPHSGSSMPPGVSCAPSIACRPGPAPARCSGTGVMTAGSGSPAVCTSCG